MLALDGSVTSSIHTLEGGDLFMEDAMAWVGDTIAVGTFGGLTLLDPGGAVKATLPARTRAVVAHDGTLLRTSRDALERVDVDGTVVASVPVVDPRAVAATEGALFVLTTIADSVEREVLVIDPSDLTVTDRWPLNANTLDAGSDVLGSTNLSTATLLDARGSELRLLRTDSVASDLVDLAFVGPWVAGSGFSAGVALFEVASGRMLAQAPGETGRGVVLDGDRRILAGGAEGVLVYTIEP